MTKSRRVINVITGLIAILFGVALVLNPEMNLPAILIVVGVSMTIRGIGALIYYFTMARFAVGGESSLFRGILFLDVGLFLPAVKDHPTATIIIYVACITAFTGVVSLLRARESKSLGSSGWKYSAAQGVIYIALAVAAVIAAIASNDISFAVYAFDLSIFYSAVSRIRSAFKRTAIPYIP